MNGVTGFIEHMANTKTCNECNGKGKKEYLISAHDNQTEYSTCNGCKGKGEIHYMSDDDEQDYHDNYW